MFVERRKVNFFSARDHSKDNKYQVNFKKDKTTNFWDMNYFSLETRVWYLIIMREFYFSKIGFKETFRRKIARIYPHIN